MPRAHRTSENVQCSICGLTFRVRGFANHTKKCKKKQQEEKDDEEIERIIRQAQKRRESFGHSYVQFTSDIW